MRIIIICMSLCVAEVHDARNPVYTVYMSAHNALEAILCSCCGHVFTLDGPYCEAIVPLPTAIDNGVAMMPKEEFVEPAEGAVS